MMEPCKHVWAIEPARPGQNGKSDGVCKECGETRQFANSVRVNKPFGGFVFLDPSFRAQDAELSGDVSAAAVVTRDYTRRRQRTDS